MESKALDPVDFREAQHKHWGKELSEFNDSADGHISERLVELADVQSGSRVLDVAAGYGEPALTAAPWTAPIRNMCGYAPICNDLGTSARKCPKSEMTV